MYYDDCAPSVDLFKTVYTLSSFHAFSEPCVKSTADAEIVVPRLRWVTWPRLSKVPSAPVSRSEYSPACVVYCKPDWALPNFSVLVTEFIQLHFFFFFFFFFSPLTEHTTRNELLLLLIFKKLVHLWWWWWWWCVRACVRACVCVCEREYGAGARACVCVCFNNYFFTPSQPGRWKEASSTSSRLI